MRSRDRSRWLIVAIAASGAYELALVAFLAAAAGSGGSELQVLNKSVAVIATIVLALPTLILTGLIIIRRVSRIAAVLTVGWMTVNAALWYPIEPRLSAIAVTAALIVLGALILERDGRKD